MKREHLDSRILGVLRFVDAETGLPVTSPLAAQALAAIDPLRGLYAVTAAPGFEAYAATFGAPPPVSGRDFVFLVSDPAGAYVTRRYTVTLPGSTARPIDVKMYPSPLARAAAGSAVVRATITDAADSAGLGGALVRVRLRGQAQVLARGLTDARGEALVPVPGIPITSWNGGGGGVLSTKVDVTIEAAFDPTAKGPQSTFPAPNPGAPWAPDPDALEAGFEGLVAASVDRQLSSAQHVHVSIAISLP